MQKFVLIVEDEAMLRDFYRELLESEGYSVHEAANGAEAFKLFLEYSYDAVVCDIVMPGMDGNEFYARVYEVRPELTNRFVFVSGTFEQDDFSGACPKLTKPFNNSVFLEQVRIVSERRTAASRFAKHLNARA